MTNYQQDSYGSYGYGRPKKRTSLWKRVRLKKRRKKKSIHGDREIEFHEVQKKAGRRWVSLGCFDTEDEALEILENEVGFMELAEAAREGLSYAGQG